MVHQANCLKTGKKYIGCTQETVKTCIQVHVSDAHSLVVKQGRQLDSFASHFVSFVLPGTELDKVRTHVRVQVKIL